MCATTVYICLSVPSFFLLCCILLTVVSNKDHILFRYLIPWLTIFTSFFLPDIMSFFIGYLPALLMITAAGMMAYLSQSGALHQLTYNQLVSLVTTSQHYKQPTFSSGRLTLHMVITRMPVQSEWRKLLKIV